MSERSPEVEITLHNTRTRGKERFAPIDPANVRMYVCGPTVYNYAHIGNARPVVVFDVLFRLLRHVYGEEHVTYVRNVTDVDDKINAKAAAERRADRRDHRPLPRRLSTPTWRRWARCRRPRAARHRASSPQIIAMIERWSRSGNAYAAEGHVLFNVADASPTTASFAGRSLDDMIAGARVEVAPYKQRPGGLRALEAVERRPSRAGTAPGAPAGPAGTSSARR